MNKEPIFKSVSRRLVLHFKTLETCVFYRNSDDELRCEVTPDNKTNRTIAKSGAWAAGFLRKEDSEGLFNEQG